MSTLMTACLTRRRASYLRTSTFSPLDMLLLGRVFVRKEATEM